MTDKTRYRVWSQGKEYELLSTITDPGVLVDAYDYAISQGSRRWVEVEDSGIKGLIRWDTITRIELFNQDIPF